MYSPGLRKVNLVLSGIVCEALIVKLFPLIELIVIGLLPVDAVFKAVVPLSTIPVTKPVTESIVTVVLFVTSVSFTWFTTLGAAVTEAKYFLIDVSDVSPAAYQISVTELEGRLAAFFQTKSICPAAPAATLNVLGVLKL